eukprot:TRINITY_DN48873_c0_g1_i1.p1 TRINITY_DN48873_c0_g1~~TRINITY_DN48873_c0_g1_i1.p1  ORF type:complete len:236 (+),score=40.20 TRINITY_DN48873_c0_g1_i1:72-779(+)
MQRTCRPHRWASHGMHSVRTFAWGSGAAGLGKVDAMKMFEEKQAREQRTEKASAYLSSRDAPKATVGGKGYVPPLARSAVSEAADRAVVHDGTQAERSIRAWLEAGGDKGLKGSGAPLPEKEEHNYSFDSDAGTQALNRALKDAGIKPSSIEAAEALRQAEERVVKGLKFALRKNRDASTMELEDSVRMARAHCAELVAQYNSAALIDKETFGSSWPMNQRKQRSIDEEILLARA